MKKFLLFTLCTLIVSNSFAQQFPKVILAGDYPDPTIMRDGKDYYMTHSPFYYMPGFLIWHSQDLINWEPVTRALPKYEGSAMAPDLLKFNGRFYLYYPAAGTVWVTWSEHIEGPWSTPIDLKIKGIDPGHIVDKDGKRYLYVNKGEVVALTDDGLAKVGEQKVVYDGWSYPADWTVECKCLESPKLIYRDGYYYMISAEGGTAGPATSHMAIVARSKNVTGPWENCPYNPLVHTYNANDAWWSKGHGTLIDDVNGNWWIVYHAYKNGLHTLGRQTLIDPVEWTQDGWPRLKETPTVVSPTNPKNKGLQLSDNFDNKQLSLQWTFWKENASEQIALKNRALAVSGKGDNPANGRLLLTIPTDQSYDTQVIVNTETGGDGGLILFYNENAYAGVTMHEKSFTIYTGEGKQEKRPNEFGKQVYLRIENRKNKCDFLASTDGKKWTTLVSNVDVSSLNHNKYRGFYALRIALTALGPGNTKFKSFKYNSIP